ncbi:sigma-70 family RNA polymerase sigma factor [Actinacidiphila oryziradicis]|uniref:Sigma-70 family RNA polymerase sigma factor n=1 Tax=Actinacidiphila oryziradicis TaxID=2571141 RepID=A0A4U0RLW9_9ACTN|nr:sigma-70 family RNA polymerase sigma factor [Actinacidiphila oryziradicis]TJZ96755.1 sigma-70 family RNA polymerase sigma factor [Actinacidiphila oryziradicis]
MPPHQPEGEPPSSKPGRKLGPIADSVGAAHRAWLEPLRTRFLGSRLTISDLSGSTGYAKSKISELLRGAGLYPRWEITNSVLHVLGVPTWPMRRLWAAAAFEAQKKPAWVKGCIATVAISTGPAVPPLDHQGFMQLNRVPYTRYAQIFLCSDQAKQVVRATSDILWLRWEEALGSADVQKFAWPVLRAGVMARTPHIDGRPELVPAAFDTVVLGATTSGTARFEQIEESMGLFKALSRLPDHQLDVMALKYLRGMDDGAVADVLGVPLAAVRSADRYAKRSLTETLGPHDPPGETPQ